ncbi:hypothetical protein BIV57_22515 [Mangrovactinospora gilvigrisea]|uniref:DUF1360 domain-containing protein n=1 Tax=Mangrovactinospora gilvigrisea TaxID=1428644 RepID=A0A1J7B9H6_9ACTN|nr:DUF1360 domain-containing protein [Mangrovactinospora gilvigrisea]OIV35262.1 hypothetical protein BIV57_22515 [Mangrovactinospora gilvigrisea]
MLPWLTIGLTIAAHFRLTRLITDDTLLQPLRDWGARTADWLGTLLECAWCAGLWIAAGLTALAYLVGETTWYRAACIALGISWLYGIASQWLDSPPPSRQQEITLIHVNRETGRR